MPLFAEGVGHVGRLGGRGCWTCVTAQFPSQLSPSSRSSQSCQLVSVQLPFTPSFTSHLTFPLAQICPVEAATRVCIQPFHPSRLLDNSAKPAVPSPAVAAFFCILERLLPLGTGWEVRCESASAAVHRPQSVVCCQLSVLGRWNSIRRWVRMKLVAVVQQGEEGLSQL